MKPKGMTDAPKSRGIILAIIYVGSIIQGCSSSKISNLRLCGDKECKNALSYGRTLAKHMQNDPVFLNFERNEIIEITSKSAGDRPDLWGGRANGKTGYFPRSFVREYKVENPSPKYYVPTEIGDGKVVEIEKNPAEPAQKSADDTEVDDTEDQDDTEVEDEDDDVWWEEDEDKERLNEEKQKEQVKPVSPPSKEKDTEEVKINERGEESNEGVKDGSSTGSPEQAGGSEEKGEPLKPVVNSEKDPTEVEETKEGRENMGNKAEEGSHIQVKKENRVKEKLDELRESLYSLHDFDDKDKVDVDELNKMLEEGASKKLAESADLPSPRSDVPSTESKQKQPETQKDATADKETQKDATADTETQKDATADTETQENVKLPGLSELFKDTADDTLKTPQDEKTPEKDDTEIADETEIGTEESSSDGKRAVIEEAGKGAPSSHPGGVPVSMENEGNKAENEIQPSSVLQEKEEKTPLESSFSAEVSTPQSVGVKVGSSTPGLTSLPASVTSTSTQVEATQQPDMEGYTIIDGTPFPLDMFEEPTPTGSVGDQTEAGTVSSTPTQLESSSAVVDQTVKSSSAVVDQTVKSSAENQKIQSASQSEAQTEALSNTKAEAMSNAPRETVSNTEKEILSNTQADVVSKSQADTVLQTKTEVVGELLKANSESSLSGSQSDSLLETSLANTGPSSDIAPTQTESVSKSSQVGKDDEESKERMESETRTRKQDGAQQDTEKSDMTDMEKSSRNTEEESKVEEMKKDESGTRKQDGAQQDTEKSDMTDMEKSSRNTKEESKVEEMKKDENIVDKTQQRYDTQELTEKTSSENVSDRQARAEEVGGKPQETSQEKVEISGQEETKQSDEGEPDLSVLKFLDDEETNTDLPTTNENVKEMDIPKEDVKTEREDILKKEAKTEDEGNQKRLSQEMTEKPIQEQTTMSSADPSTSSTEQLMSSMEIDYSVETKMVIDNTRNTDFGGGQQNATQTVVETDNLKLELPTNVDAYATADFLSRKPLSHEPLTQSSSQKSEDISVAVGDDLKKESVTQASSESPQEKTDQVTSAAPGNVQDSTQETVTVPPVESTTLSGPDDGEIPPPSTESKETSTQPSTGSSTGEPLVAAKDDEKKKSESTQDIKPSSTEEAAASSSVVTESPTAGEQASTNFYDQEEFLSRKINDGDLEEKEDLAYKAERSWTKGDQFLRSIISWLPPSLQALLEQEPLGLTPQMTILVTMVTFATLMAVTCFSFICGGGRKTKKQDPVVVVRGLEEKLFILTKEKENLEDELNALQQKMADTEEDTKSTQSSVSSIQKDLQTLQLHNNSLKEQVETLEEENTEIKKDLSGKAKELKSKDNQLKESEKQIKQKDEKYNKTNEKLKETNKELQEKSGEIKTLKSQIHGLTEQVSHLEANKAQLGEEARVWNEKVQELTEQLDYVKGEQKQMSEDLAYKENEIEVLRDCFLQLKAFQEQVGEEGGDETDSGNIESKLKSMMDVSQVSAKLKAVEEEKNSLDNRLEIEMQSRRDMEERILDLERKAESLQSDKMKAERQNSEAQTKLDVLSNYFKQKEIELQRELGEQEALKKMNINKLENSDTRTKMMQEELDGSKAQVEDLKREILSAERDFRSQIAANEKKAHENWLAARAAERELKESRHEASVMRQKLTDLERRLMQGPPGGLIRPVPSRGMPPPGMINGPPLPGMERPGSRGRLPPTGPRDEDFPGSPGPDSDRRPPPPLGPDDRRIPPFNPDDRRMPFPDDRRIPPMEGPDRRPMGSRVPPPHPMELRSPPPFDRRPPPPMDRRSPPPYDRGLRPHPPPLDRRSPGHRMPFPPDMPPHMRGPPRGPLSPPLRNDGPAGVDTPPYRPPHDPDREPRQQSQV
uniref:Transport and Golgi organization protein 1 homolog isoform X3 n=1 Tax=Crassostrea virginica TaxID=6565 RepID=A0A8B8DWK2_CRAVI|nr:transport and Golgi organization protein 1 homolog isoform X3 [Crassostrea virginica]